MPDTIRIQLSSDPVKHAPTGFPTKYLELFAQLTPSQNCMIFANEKEMLACVTALRAWAKASAPPGCSITQTKRYASDGKPRCWLVFPA